MSNDILAAFWSTLALALALQGRHKWPAAVGAGLCMGLAAVTKASTAALWPVVVLAMLARDLRPGSEQISAMERRQAWHALGRAVLAGFLGATVASPWLWRNWRLYGDPLGWPLVLATIDRRQGPLVLADLGQLARGWFVSFWGKFGGAGHLALPASFYWLWGAVIAGAIGGWIAYAARIRSGPATRIAPAGWVVMIGAPVMAVLAILSYSRTALGTDQGRLLFPAIAPAAFWIAGGLAAWLPSPGKRGWQPQLPALMGGLMGTVAVLALVIGIVRPFAPPQEPSPAEVANGTPVGQRFDDDLELVAYRWTEGSLPRLVLYWKALRGPEADLRTALRLADTPGSANLVWEWKRSPGAGRFPTDRWPAGRMVADEYDIPGELLDAGGVVMVGLRPFPEGPWLSVMGAQGDFIELPLQRPEPLP